jgi:hypothetical protein
MGEMIMYIVLAGILTADILFVRFKFTRQGFFPAAIDIGLLVMINSILGGTIAGEIIGTVAAFFISIWLWFYPPKLLLKFEKRKIGFR